MTRHVNRKTESFIRNYLEALDTPHSLAIWILFKSGEHVALLDLELDPLWFNDSGLFRRSFLAHSLLKKSTFLNAYSDDHRARVAKQKFLEAEQLCRQTNLAIQQKSWGCETPDFDGLHLAVRRKICLILEGYVDHPHTDQGIRTFTGEEIVEASGWGPGATTLTSGDTSDVNKFRCEGGTTLACYELISRWFHLAYPLWTPSWTIVPGNEIITVPKNSKTDRVIAKEPGLNLWFQKGVGKCIRSRLMRYAKIDLKHQQSVNQRLAQRSSHDGSLATVDFASASDTISRRLVEELLPRRWFILLDALRSSHGSLDGVTLAYEKFSSMGNGYTFELESLIFYSLAVVCTDYCGGNTDEVSIFGDDVILPVVAYDLFVKMASHYGFTVNLKKSFSKGYFRESCGEYYFNGLDCKPYFLRQELSSDATIYRTANAIRRLSHRHTMYGCDSRFLRCWQALFESASVKLVIPEGYGDGGFIGNFDEASPSRVRYGVQGYTVKHFVELPRPYVASDHALLLSRLSRPSRDRMLGNEYSVRDRVRRVKKKLFVSSWYNLGPWWDPGC